MANILRIDNQTRGVEKKLRTVNLRREIAREIADRKRQERNLDVLAGREGSSLSQKILQAFLAGRVRRELDRVLDCSDPKEFARRLVGLNRILDNS
jgi:hypothetical protein